MHDPKQIRLEIRRQVENALWRIDAPDFAAPSKLYELCEIQVVPHWLPYRWVTYYVPRKRELLYDPVKAGRGRRLEESLGKRLVDLICRADMTDHLPHCGWGGHYLQAPDGTLLPLVKDLGPDLEALGGRFKHATYWGLADRIVDVLPRYVAIWCPDCGEPVRVSALENLTEVGRSIEKKYLDGVRSGVLAPGQQVSIGRIVVSGWRVRSYQRPGWVLLMEVPNRPLHVVPAVPAVQLPLISPEKTLSTRPPRPALVPRGLVLVPEPGLIVCAVPAPPPALLPLTGVPVAYAEGDAAIPERSTEVPDSSDAILGLAEFVIPDQTLSAAPPNATVEPSPPVVEDSAVVPVPDVAGQVAPSPPLAPVAVPPVARRIERCGSKDETTPWITDAGTGEVNYALLDEIRLLIAEGLRDRDIASRVGLHTAAVQDMAWQLQLELRATNRNVLIARLRAALPDRYPPSRGEASAPPTPGSRVGGGRGRSEDVSEAQLRDEDFLNRLGELVADELSPQEIASRTGVPVAIVRTVVDKARIDAGLPSLKALSAHLRATLPDYRRGETAPDEPLPAQRRGTEDERLERVRSLLADGLSEQAIAMRMRLAVSTAIALIERVRLEA